MTGRLVILTEIISPYRIPLFNALAAKPGISLHVVFLSETDPSLRDWRIYKEEIRFSYDVLPSWRRRAGKFNVLLNRGLARALVGASPSVILCGGYNYVASWQALLWARAHSVPFLLWSESNVQDSRRGHALVEMLKDEFIGQCDGFVVPGQSAFEYLRSHKVNPDSIFIAPNAVDNEFFCKSAEHVRLDAAGHRKELNLPGRYFLFVGRLVREKGVFEFVSAYAQLNERLRRDFGLVFVGDGPCRAQLQEDASAVSPGAIHFAGFTHREQLPIYYALAEMLALPTYTDTWGLVVNEAMACGLPIILSEAAGCAADLVTADWNGCLISPRDVSSLASAMTILATRPDLRRVMSEHSVERIAQYSPSAWAAGIARAVQPLAGKHD
jgi:glycosyltransferase involved in cell wall biosynthesis